MGKAGMGQSLRFHSQNLFTATLGPHTWEWHLGAVSRRPCSTLKAPGLRIGVCVCGGGEGPSRDFGRKSSRHMTFW